MLGDRLSLALAFRFRSREPSSAQETSDLGMGPLGALGNVIWFLRYGWWLALGHLSRALACFVTIVGIPFGISTSSWL